jgi:hypothetical protein
VGAFSFQWVEFHMTTEERVRALLDEYTAEANVHGNQCTVLRNKEEFVKRLASALLESNEQADGV